jgi:hypothetical protein
MQAEELDELSQVLINYSASLSKASLPSRIEAGNGR